MLISFLVFGKIFSFSSLIFVSLSRDLVSLSIPDLVDTALLGAQGVSLSHPRLGVPGANHRSLVSSVVSVPSSREHVSFCENSLPGGLTTRRKRFSLTQIRNGNDGFLPSGLRAFSKYVRDAGAGKRATRAVLFGFKHTTSEEMWVSAFRQIGQPVLPISVNQAYSGTVSSFGSMNLDLRSVGYGVKQSSIDVNGRPKMGSTRDLIVVAGSDDADVAGSIKDQVCASLGHPGNVVTGVAGKIEDTRSDCRSSFPMGSAPTRSKSVRFSLRVEDRSDTGLAKNSSKRVSSVVIFREGGSLAYSAIAVLQVSAMGAKPFRKRVLRNNPSVRACCGRWLVEMFLHFSRTELVSAALALARSDPGGFLLPDFSDPTPSDCWSLSLDSNVDVQVTPRTKKVGGFGLPILSSGYSGLFKVRFEPGFPDRVNCSIEIMSEGFADSASVTVIFGKDCTLMVPENDMAGRSQPAELGYYPGIRVYSRWDLNLGFKGPVETNSFNLSMTVTSGNVGTHVMLESESAGKCKMWGSLHF